MNKKTRRFLALILVFVMALGLLAACTPAADDPPPPTDPPATEAPTEAAPPPEPPPPPPGANLADHIDIIADASPITVLNPVMAGPTGGSSWVMHLTTDRLIEIRGPGIYAPGLAERWETEDFRTIRFYLRQGVVWHNGDPFTADDVAFTAEIGKDNPGGTSWTRFRLVESWEVIDRYIIDFTLYEANYDFEFEMSHWSLGILNRNEHAARPDDPLWASVGTGPYRLTSFSPGDHVTLERFDDFWGEAPPTRSITFWSIPEMATRMVMLRTGEVQASFFMDSMDLDVLLGDPNFVVIEDPSVFPNYLSFNNMGDPVQMCPYFRRAVNHALNFEDIAEVVAGNWARAWPDGNLWGTGTPFYRHGLPRREFDLALAADYLERSVWDGERMEIAVTPPAGVAAGEMIQLQLGVIGIPVDIEVMDIPTYVSEFAFTSTRQSSIFMKGFGPSAVGSGVALLMPYSVTNRINLNDDFITERLHIMAGTPDVNVQRQAAYEIQERMWELIPAIPIWMGMNTISAVPGFGGLHHWGDVFRYCLRGIYLNLDA